MNNNRYDDDPRVKYHFTTKYLSRAERAIGDWIIYYKTKDNEEPEEYYATAQVIGVEEDELRERHYYAYVANYEEFTPTVPIRQEDGTFYERGFQWEGNTKPNPGWRANSVRNIEDDEFFRIIQSGGVYEIIRDRLDDPPAELNLGPVINDLDVPYLFRDEHADIERQRIEQVINRLERSASFSRRVKRAYNNTCAITGIQLSNGAGLFEAEAAHIKPVAEQGPDFVTNGIAMSRTIHWMFDRGLISINDDYTICVTNTANIYIPEQIRIMLRNELILPEQPECYPDPRFMRHHRNHIFLG